MTSEIKYDLITQSENIDKTNDTNFEEVFRQNHQNNSIKKKCGFFSDTMVDNKKHNKIAYGVIPTTLVYAGLILFYFSLSIGLTFYQRALLKKYNFPLAVVLYHLIFKYFMSAIIRLGYRIFTGKSRISLDWQTSFKKMSLTGIASGIDIGFSNWGLGLVNISLYTMTKSSTVVFILLFAIIIGLEKPVWSLLSIVILISTGLFMFTYKSTDFNALGFSFLLFASVSSGVRWSFAQLVMQKSKLGLHNPIDMVYHMQPWMIFAILPFTFGFEGKILLVESIKLTSVSFVILLHVWLEITYGALIAFVMELSEFLVLSFTSSLTLSISGVFKEIILLVLAVKFNGDQLSWLNIFGLILCLTGICIHVLHKHSSIQNIDHNVKVDGINNIVHNDRSELKLNHQTQQNIPLLNKEEIENSNSDDESKSDNHKGSDVIFDVLKRRDMRI